MKKKYTKSSNQHNYNWTIKFENLKLPDNLESSVIFWLTYLVKYLQFMPELYKNKMSTDDTIISITWKFCFLYYWNEDENQLNKH